jgi:Transposase IS66 family
MSTPEKITLSGLPRGELEALAERLLAENAALRQAIAELRAEVAALKGVKGRPKVRPSGMEKGTEPEPDARDRGRGGRGKVNRLTIHEERVIAADVPVGSRFKSYEDFLVQDLVLRPHVVRLRRERWLTPDGRTVTAPMPAGIVGHFGPELRRFVLFQYHQGQVTVPRLVAQLRAIGIAISKRQVVRLLNEGQGTFLDEAREVLRAGLSAASWISVDDTGARHQHRNGVCTQLGNDHFTAFVTTASKSRLNFLRVLRAGYRDYVINAEALAYMRQRALAGPVITSLAEHPERHFPDGAAWLRHLDRLGITALAVTPDPVRIAAEGAVRGSVKAHGLLPDTVILSDDAGQFALDRHALCRIHAERLVHRLDTFTERQHAAQRLIRALIWWSYADLKAYRRAPDRRRRYELRARFERIFRRRTGSATLDRLLARLHANKEELLTGRARPTGAAAAHQRLGAGAASAGDQAEDLRRHARRSRP